MIVSIAILRNESHMNVIRRSKRSRFAYTKRYRFLLRLLRLTLFQTLRIITLHYTPEEYRGLGMESYYVYYCRRKE